MTNDAVEVVGREAELAHILAFLRDVDELPAALSIEGGAGIGKTTLWQAGIEAAKTSSFSVLTARPVEAETALSFAALGDLLDDYLEDTVPGLPPPQRHALEVALSLVEPGTEPLHLRAVAMGFLGVLRALAASGRVLVAVDDVQWLDSPSADIMQFAARRLRDEPVAFLLTRRDPVVPRVSELEAAFPERRLQRHPVQPLSPRATHQLLRDRLAGDPPRSVLQRLHDASGGNPFLALELGRALEARGYRLDLFESLPGAGELVRHRLEKLPTETLAALAAAAGLSQPTVAVVSSAAGAGATALEPAVRAGLIALDGDRVRFTHPLFASGVYATLDTDDRRQLHARLAELVRDPEERAHQLARCTTEPDADVASALDQAGRLAAARGSTFAAADFAELARRLTPPSRGDERARRTLVAARHHFDAGDTQRAQTLLEEIAASGAGRGLQVEALTRLGRAHAFTDDLRSGAACYRRALALAAPTDPLRASAEAGLAIALFRMLEDLPAAANHARAATELSAGAGDKGMQADFLAIQGLVEALLGRRTALTAVRRATELVSAGDELADLAPSIFLRGTFGVSYDRAFHLLLTDEVDGARVLFEQALEHVRELGDDGSLPLVLRHLSYIEWLVGNWTQASDLASEGHEIARQMGQPIQEAVLVGMRALLDSHLGHIDSARAEAQEGVALAEQTGEMWAKGLSLTALGALELALGNPAETHRHLGPFAERIIAAGVREPGAVVARFMPDEIEALVALGRLEDAEALLARLEKWASRLDRASARAAAARCRALVCEAQGDLPGARAAFDSAFEQHQRVTIPFERARTLLALGSTQRRARERRAARGSYEQALLLFDELGARLWSRRARAELGRISGRAPTTGELTPTERSVAELVAEGRSNKEVAAELVVSVRTVESTLTKVYAKLGVRSRTELARQLGTDTASKVS